MATKVITQIEDDLTGGPAETSYNFGFEGQQYEIDLNAENAEAFESMIGPYIQVARRARLTPTGRPSKAARTSSDAPAAPRTPRRTQLGPDPAAVRAWAASNGITVSEKGRISRAVLEQFQAAMG